jgi:hypothetical protein
MNPLMRNIVFVLLALAVASCNLEQEIELELPVAENKLVVECYLEPGQPFTLLLSRTAGYFEPFPTDQAEFVSGLLVDGATVRIRHNGETYELDNGFFFNPFTLKFFNYGSDAIVPEDFENAFELEITTADGEVITATTKILPPVPIDTVEVQFNNTDSLARTLVFFPDDPNAENFYRNMLHLNSLDSIPQQDFPLNDQFVDNGALVFGTNYDFSRGDVVYHTIYHLDRAYYDFIVSLQNALASNGNPFAQPGGIISNVSGDAIGIFTGLSYDRKMTLIE